MRHLWRTHQNGARELAHTGMLVQRSAHPGRVMLRRNGRTMAIYGTVRAAMAAAERIADAEAWQRGKAA